jgi:hypothetical protein
MFTPEAALPLVSCAHIVMHARLRVQSEGRLKAEAGPERLEVGAADHGVHVQGASNRQRHSAVRTSYVNMIFSSLPTFNFAFIFSEARSMSSLPFAAAGASLPAREQMQMFS